MEHVYCTGDIRLGGNVFSQLHRTKNKQHPESDFSFRTPR